MTKLKPMSDIRKSVSGKKKYAEDWVGSQEIQKDKLKKEEELSYQAESLLYAAFMILIKKFVSFFSTKVAQQVVDQHQIVEDLLSFKKMLEILANEDQSHNPEFTQELAELWHNLINVYLHKEALPEDNALAKLSIFIEKIHSYPPAEEHSLGYYLTEYAGKEWLPFPFMDILHQLYQQHQENPLGSEIAEWIAQLNDITLSFE